MDNEQNYFAKQFHYSKGTIKNIFSSSNPLTTSGKIKVVLLMITLIHETYRWQITFSNVYKGDIQRFFYTLKQKT